MTNSSIHSQPHPLAGRTVSLADVIGDGTELQRGGEFRIEDYWDRISGRSWTTSDGNPAAMKYGLRLGLSGTRVSLDDEVVYGKDKAGIGHLVHCAELGDPT